MLFQMPRDTVEIRDQVRSSEDTELLKEGRRVEEWAGVRAQAWKQELSFKTPYGAKCAKCYLNIDSPLYQAG